MFADMKSMVIKAWRERYALLAINCMNLESARAAVRVAEKHRAPIILNLYQGHLSHFPATTAAAVVRVLAEEASVPVTLSLDHGKEPIKIRQAFRAGFSGLMIDASAFALAENIRQTREVAELAASVGLCVEGELGHLADAPRYDQASNADLMTQPQDVPPFIEQTGIDLLAVSVGTAHGMYAPGVKPMLDSARHPCRWRCTAGAVRRSSSCNVARNSGSQKSTLGRRYLKRGKRRCCTPCATTAPLSWPMRYR